MAHSPIKNQYLKDKSKEKNHQNEEQKIGGEKGKSHITHDKKYSKIFVIRITKGEKKTLWQKQYLKKKTYRNFPKLYKTPKNTFKRALQTSKWCYNSFIEFFSLSTKHKYEFPIPKEFYS